MPIDFIPEPEAQTAEFDFQPEEGGEQLTASELVAIDAEAANFPKKPAIGVGGAFFRGVQQPFKSFGMAPGIPLLSDKTLGEHLEEEYRNLNRREAPGIPVQVSETIGGLAGTVGQLMAHQYLTRGRVPARATAAATFGTSGAYNAFLKAGMNALSEGKSTEEALDIAKKASLVGAGVGAVTGAVLPPGAENFRQALRQGAMLGGLGAAGAATENVAERALGLQTPLMSGVVPAGGTMGVIPPVLYGLSLAMRSRARPLPVRPKAPATKEPVVEAVPARTEPPAIETTTTLKESIQPEIEARNPVIQGIPENALFQGVRSGNIESKHGKSNWLTDTISYAEMHSKREGGEGRIDVYDPSQLPPMEQMMEGGVSKTGPNAYSFTGLGQIEPIGTLVKEGGSYIFKPNQKQPEASPEGKRGLIVEPYSTPMLERLDSLGGPVSRKVASEARQIDTDAVTMAGRIGPVVDKARQLASRAFRGGTTWIRGKEDVTPTAAISRLHSLEGIDKAEVVQRAPEQAREMVDAIWEANTTAIGGLATEANVGFAPQGRIQRILTGRGMDIVREGGGKLWNRLVEGTAKANGKSIEETRDFFREFKAMLDDPSPDSAKVDKIAQDFHREFPKAITHVKSGPQWIEVLVSDPVDYLKAATERTARAAAFRKVYPNTPEGRQALVDAHKAVLAELPTASRKEEFNNLIKVLQGHRLDTDLTTKTAGIPGEQEAMEGVSLVTRPLKASMLSLSSLANAAETVIGGPAIFLKYKNIIPLLTRNPVRFYKQLEMGGLVDKATRNFAFNPIKPAQSVSRMVSEGIGRLTMNNFWNEVQEYTGSGGARIFADRVRANDLTLGERADFESTLRAMGFRDKFEDIAAGRDLEGLAQFEAQAAPFLSAGRQRPATSSRLGNSRAFNALFWFHRYPQMVLNQARGILNNLIEDAQTKNPHHAYRDLKLASRFLGFKAAQGALMTLIVTAVKEGGEGVAQMIREAREAFGGFLWQVTANAIGGPVTIANRIGQRASTGEDVAMEAIKASAPVSSGIDLFNALAGKGRYNGLDAFETAAQFIQSKTPAIPAVRSAMGVVGLADDNPKLRAATTGFYRWARKQGYKWPEGRPKDARFTATMRQTVREMERGGEWQETLRKAMAVKTEAGQDARRSVQQSLQQRKILRNQFGGALSADEMDSLRSWVGEDNFQVLQQRDAMIDAVADLFGKGSVSVDKEPTTKEAVAQQVFRIKARGKNGATLNVEVAGLDESDARKKLLEALAA